MPDLEIPPFVSVGGGSEGPGFLGMAYAPFVVDSNGQVRNLNMGIDAATASMQRDDACCAVARKAASSPEPRRPRPTDHAKVLDKTLEPDDQRADGGLQGQPRSRKEVRDTLRQQRLRPRLPDGPPAGRGGRAVRRSRSRRLGQPRRHLPDARRTRSCPSSTRR